MAEVDELKKLRAVLTQQLDDKGAAAALFIGLDRHGDIPVTTEGWVQLVRSGLREALRERLEPGEAERLVRELEDVLTGVTEIPPPPEDDVKATRELPRLDAPSKVLVVAGGSRLARTLKAALGSRVVPMAVGDAARVANFIADFEPGVLVVDLADPIADLGASVADGLEDHGLVVIWGTGPKAKQLAAELEQRGKRATVFDRNEGVGPLVELVHAAAS